MKYLLIALLIFVLPANAATIDFATELTQLDGKSFADPADNLSPAEKAVVDVLIGRGYLVTRPHKTTLSDVAIQGLLSPVQSDDPKEKLRKFTVAQKIQGAKDHKIDLSVEEIALVKDVIAKQYPPLVMGQAWKILDPSSVP